MITQIFSTPINFMLTRLCSLISACALAMLAPSLALAEEAHHHGAGHGTMPPPFGDFISHLGIFWMNFGLFVLMLFFVLRRVFSQGWAARRAAILSAVDTGTSALRESEKILNEAKNKMSRLSSEVARVRSALSADTAAEAEKISEEAARRSDQILKRANDSVQSESRALEKELERLLFEEAISKAKEKLAREITPQMDEKLRERALSQASGLVN